MNTQKRILMVFSFPPYPLRANGNSVRYFPIIEYLSRKHLLDIVVISKNSRDEVDLDDLRGYCRKLIVVKRDDSGEKSFWEKLRINLVSLLPWEPPLLYVHYNKDEIIKRIAEATKEEPYDVFLWVTAHSSACLFPLLKRVTAKRLVIDFIDSPTLLAEREMERASVFSIRERFEGWKIKRWETKLSNVASSTIYISPVDASKNERICPRPGVGIDLPNGIGIEDYTADRQLDIRSPAIGFLGNMGYSPNIEAVEWLYERVFSPLSREIEGLSLVIIGRNPNEKIRKLGDQPNVIVTGEVQNIWSYVNSVDLFIFPLWIGGGIKNKILEAMFARTPVVTTTIGNEGIDGVNGKHLYICSREYDFIQVARRLIRSKDDRDRIGEAAHEYVIERFSWKNILKEFERAIIGY